MKTHMKHQSGFSLIEVLIGIIVVSIGLLTVAALQVVTKKANYEAVQRTTASLLAYDMAERMRANRDNLAAYLVPVASPLGGGAIASEPAPDCTVGNTCSPGQLAAHDLWEWEQALDGQTEVASIAGVDTQTGGIVVPSACITGPGGGGAGLYTIAIAWRGTSPLANSNAPSTCGQGSGDYGTNDEYRRVLVYQIYIS